MINSLAHSKALVTGSSRGIGRATAIALAEAGCDIAIHYHRQRQDALDVADRITQLGRQSLVIQANLENPEERAQMFAEIEDQWGRLNIFVANAAATSFKTVLELKPYHLHRTYAVVLESFVDAAQRSLPLMQMDTKPGRIIAISSLGSQYTLPRYANIGSAKAALESMVRYLANEFGPYGITCNAISPGVVATDSSHYYAQDQYQDFLAAVTQRTPLGRLVTDRDVAQTVLFFAGENAAMITGQILQLDGGASLPAAGFDALPSG
jgi:enoyl-[acyl-carrier protein] reductase III